jgi:hypothetical protein
MDRQTVYAGQIVLETDQLRQSQNAMVALAKLAAAVLGQTTIVNGFTCTPTTPASLNVLVTAGEVYQLENLEQSSWSTLSTDTHTILKQGIVLDPTTFGITPPGTVGFSQNFLVEVQYQDLDTGSTVLPYFNAANPQQPFAGPANAGTAQNTVRKGIAALQVKAGVAATTGTQTTPTPDVGWTGLFVVTVANGAATITAGNITQYASAPFIPAPLPNIPTGVQAGSWVYWLDSGSAANTYVITPLPVVAAYAAGLELEVKIAHTNTGASTLNVNGLGAKAIVRNSDGAAVIAGDLQAGALYRMAYDGTSFRVLRMLLSEVKVLLNAPPTGLVTYATPGTYTFTAPAGVNWVFVRAWGGGGGGGGASATSSTAAGGGGAGYAHGFVPVTPGNNYTVVVGAAGIAGSAPGVSGGNGGNTTFNGTDIVAGGGQGGGGTNNSQNAVQVSGGTASFGGTVVGGLAMVGAIGQDGASGGQGGGSPQGGPPQPRAITNAGNNNTGITPGGGGPAGTSAGGAAQPGGNGGSGLLVLQLYS